MTTLPRASPTLRFHLSLRGQSTLVEHLGEALRAQWAFGFPIVPKGFSQLTNGFVRAHHREHAGWACTCPRARC